MPEETNISEVNFGKTIPLKFKKMDELHHMTLKKDVLDPQGKVVENTLANMGINSLKSIRQGKYFQIEIDDNNQETAEKKLMKCVKNF